MIICPNGWELVKWEVSVYGGHRERERVRLCTVHVYLVATASSTTNIQAGREISWWDEAGHRDRRTVSWLKLNHPEVLGLCRIQQPTQILVSQSWWKQGKIQRVFFEVLREPNSDPTESLMSTQGEAPDTLYKNFSLRKIRDPVSTRGVEGHGQSRY